MTEVGQADVAVVLAPVVFSGVAAGVVEVVFRLKGLLDCVITAEVFNYEEVERCDVKMGDVLNVELLQRQQQIVDDRTDLVQVQRFVALD